MTRSYRLLPYLYTSMYLASSLGGTVARPLFFEWPTDVGALAASDTQWLLGGRDGEGRGTNGPHMHVQQRLPA